MIDSLTLKKYKKEVKELLKKQYESRVENVDKTLMLRGELKAINKIIDMMK